MERVEYSGYIVELGDMDNEKCSGWKAHHWKCTAKDKVNRTQMSFDVFGAVLCTTMKPLEALYYFVSDACDYMNVNDAEDVMDEFGYKDYKEAKAIYKALEKSYYKCRRFIGSDNDILELENELNDLL